MRYTIGLIGALAMLCLLATTPTAAAITVNGHTFDSTSATLTNPYYTLDKHFYFLREDGEHGVIQYIIDKEMIAGVECAKICQNNGGQNYWWLAQDVNGDIFLFKGQTYDYIWHDADNDDDISLWIGTTPTVGDQRSGFLDNTPFFEEIMDANATFGSHTGCFKSNRIADNGHEWDIYFKSGLCIVGFNYRESASSPWIRYDRIYNTDGQAEYAPAILPGHWVGGCFQSGNYNGSIYVSMNNDVSFVDHDGIVPLGSHYATATFPDGKTWNVPPNSIFDYLVSYYLTIGSYSPFSGTMTYYAYDVAGNKSAPFLDEVSYGTVPVVDDSTIQISPDGTTPTISWDAPVGNPQDKTIVYYRTRVTNPGEGNSLFDGFTKATHYKIPPGALEPNTEYQVAIEARAEPSGQNRNTISRSARVSFTTGNVSQSPYTSLSFYSRGVRVYYTPRVEAPYLSFYLRVHDAQGVPGNIDSVTVQVPGVGSLPLFFRDNVSVTEGTYQTHYYRSIPAGIYTFTIADKDGHVFSVNQNLNPQPLPAVSKSSMSPPNNSVISADSVTFSWDPIGGASLYELVFYDSEGHYVENFKITASATPQLTIGRSFLKKYEQYHWMVFAWDVFRDQIPQNISGADWETMSPSIMNGRLPGSNAPSINLAGFGTYINTTAGIDPTRTVYWLSHYIQIVDSDGVPGNIASVTVRYPDGTIKDLYIDSVWEDMHAGYFREELLGESASAAQIGDYIYTVTDNEGKTASVTDHFTLAPLDRIKHFAPQKGAVLPVNGVVFSCAAVKDAVKYRYRIRDHWGYGYSYRSGFIDSISHVVPEGELAEDWIYRLRIAAYREDPTIGDVDNRATTQWQWGGQNHFLTASATPPATDTLTLPAGELVEDYRIVALPLGPDNPDPATALNITPEEYDTKYMRLGQWNTKTQAYDEFPNFSPLGPGDAFWALFREGKTIALDGIETALVDHPTLSPEKAYRRPIDYDWNMIGNPFPHTIGIGDIVVSDTPGQYATISEGTITQSVFWVYHDGAYQAAATLGAGEGGWLKKITPGTGSIYFAAIPRVAETITVSVRADSEKPPPPPGSLGTTPFNSTDSGGGGCYIDAISGR